MESEDSTSKSPFESVKSLFGNLPPTSIAETDIVPDEEADDILRSISTQCAMMDDNGRGDAATFVTYDSLPPAVEDDNVMRLADDGFGTAYVVASLSRNARSATSVRVFLGGLLFGMDQVAIARLASFLSGTGVSKSDVVVFKRGPEMQNTGSAIVSVPTLESAQRMMSFNKRALCEAGGIRVMESLHAMMSYADTITARGGRGPHPLVVEQARTRGRHPPREGIPPMVHHHPHHPNPMGQQHPMRHSHTKQRTTPQFMLPPLPMPYPSLPVPSYAESGTGMAPPSQYWGGPMVNYPAM